MRAPSTAFRGKRLTTRPQGWGDSSQQHRRRFAFQGQKAGKKIRQYAGFFDASKAPALPEGFHAGIQEKTNLMKPTQKKKWESPTFNETPVCFECSSYCLVL